MRREYIFDGRSILACDAQSNPSVINFTWYKGNKTITDVANTETGGTDVTADVKGSKQSAVMVLADTDVEAYYCIATNAIGPSKACRLQVQQIANGMYAFKRKIPLKYVNNGVLTLLLIPFTFIHVLNILLLFFSSVLQLKHKMCLFLFH